MNPKTLVAAGLAVLVAAAGGGAALTGTGVQSLNASEDPATGPRDVDVTAVHDNGTVTVTVTSDGDGVENVTVSADDERVGPTAADGTVTVETNASEELELELTKGEFEGSVEYRFQDGSLTLVEEEYEYGEPEDVGEAETGDVEDDGDAGDDVAENEDGDQEENEKGDVAENEESDVAENEEGDDEDERDD